MKIAPSNPGSYVDVAAIYRMKRDYEMARHWANQGRNIGPDSYLPYDSLGAIACLESNYDEALVNFSKALRLAPKKLNVVIDRASCMHRMGDIASAISYVKEAIVVADVSDPKLVELYVMLGNWYEEIGSVAEARQTYEQALVLWPENPAVRAKLDRLLASKPSSKP